MKRNIILAVLGALVAIAGFVLVILGRSSEPLQIPGFLAVGVGCGLFGHNLGTLLAKGAACRDPEAAKRITVEQQDERNVALVSRAKAKAYDGMIYIFGALMLVFALARIPVWAVLSLVAAYLLVFGLNVYYLSKFQREM